MSFSYSTSFNIIILPIIIMVIMVVMVIVAKMAKQHKILNFVLAFTTFATKVAFTIKVAFVAKVAFAWVDIISKRLMATFALVVKFTS